jgi:hypothetical protein
MRTESKYIISYEKYLELKDYFGFILTPDEYSKNGAYPISTVYYDTPTLDYFYDKVNGEYLHKKARLRSYGESPFSGQTYFEYKIKYNDSQFKKRIKITENIDLLNVVSYAKNRDLDFVTNLVEENLIPVNFVKYYREAFFINSESGQTRVNFDLGISICEVGQTPSFEHLVFPDKRVVLEVKTPGRYCDPMVREILKSCEAHRTTFSKYATGINLISRTYGMETPNEF